MKALTVLENFGSYAKGDQITDAKEVEDVLASDQAHSVVKVELPDEAPKPGKPE